MSAQVKVADRICEWQPVIPAHLRPIVAEVIQLFEPAFRFGQVTFIEICLNFRLQFVCTLGRSQVRRFRRPGRGRGLGVFVGVTVIVAVGSGVLVEVGTAAAVLQAKETSINSDTNKNKGIGFWGCIFPLWKSDVYNTAII